MATGTLNPPDKIGEAGRGAVSIGEACLATGLSQRTVRYYEELGLVPGVRRRTAGRRVYDEDNLQRLRFINRLKALGLSLAEIKELNAVYGIAGSTSDMLMHLDGQLGNRLADLDARIEDLVALRDEMSRYRDHIEDRIHAVAPGTQASPPVAQSGSHKERTEK